jgi:uncharacterized membrane protein YphA (DoxX/SURF4 family)
LRVVVGASATIEAGVIVEQSSSLARIIAIAALSVVVAALALVLGFLTPISSALVCLGGVGALTLTSEPSATLLLFDSRMAAVELVVMSGVLAVLGPGAFSIDARLFGRREVAIHDARRPDDG